MRVLSDKHIRRYKEDGFLYLPRFLKKRDVANIRTGYRDCLASMPVGVHTDYEADGETVRSFMNYHFVNPALDHYTRHPKVLSAVNQIVNSEVYVTQSKINAKAPMGEGITKGKQWLYHRGFSFWYLLDGIKNPTMTSAFIFLSEHSEENGAVYVLSGSHADFNVSRLYDELDPSVRFTYDVVDRQNDTAEDLSLKINPEYLREYEEDHDLVYLEGDPGDFVLMDPRLLHASGENYTEKSRDVMITVYNPVGNQPEHPREDLHICAPYVGPVYPSEGVIS